MSAFHDRRRLRRLALVSSSLIALGIGSQATAQSYNASDPVVRSGNVQVTHNGGNSTYTVSSPTAVLDFTPNDTAGGTSAIDFQKLNSTALYSGASNFTVLNRILPTSSGRAVQFNGTVRSQVNGSTGGTVWFYSPGGIIASPTSVFDVGNLLLTARDPANGGNSISSTTSFTGGGTGEAGIVINAGAQINALAEGSYIAMVAPRIVIDGSVRVNGQAVLVAAEQAQLTINGGLFDIIVNSGSEAGGGFPLQILGSVGGPASTGANDPHNIIAVALPKNNAATALIGGTGNIGFDVATAAGVSNGKVYLFSGMQNITGSGTGWGAQFNVAGDIHINGGRFTSDVIAQARQNVYAASLTGTAQFDRDLTIRAVNNAHVAARQNGVTMHIGGNLYISADRYELTGTNRGGSALLYTENGGILDIVGGAQLYASAAADDPNQILNSTAIGGTASIFTQGGGGIRIGGTTVVDASARGSIATAIAGYRATLTGGTATINAGNGAINLVGSVTVSANAIGSSTGSTTASSVATGGTARITTSVGNSLGRITIGGSASVQAFAAADRSNVTGGINGTAVGGFADVRVDDGALSVAGQLSLNASGYAGNTVLASRPGVLAGSVAANGTGGTAMLQVYGSTATIGSVSVIAAGNGTVNRGGGNGVGGTGTGGSAFIVANGGTTTINGAVTMIADGVGGDKTEGQTGGGGRGTGGNATFRANGGTLAVAGGVSVQAVGSGGASSGTGVIGNGGAGNGGGARIDTTAAGSRLTVGGLAQLNASGVGGNATVTAGSTGGTGTAGTGSQQTNFVNGAYVVTQGGSIGLNGGLNMITTGLGGTGAIGGAGVGGLSNVVAQIGTITVGGTATIDAGAAGGNALTGTGVGGGAGGSGTAGEVYVYAQASQAGSGGLQFGTANFYAQGQGGNGAAGLNGGTGGAGGTGLGGLLSARAMASSLGISTTSLYASSGAQGGIGGAGGTGTGGAGGAATAGTVYAGTVSGPDLTANSGFANYGNTQLYAVAYGGAGGNGAIGGRGGNATGGLAEVLARGTAVTFGTLNMISGATGALGGTGATAAAAGARGDGLGGAVVILASNRFQRTERGSVTAGVTSLGMYGESGLVGATQGARGTATDGEFLLQATSGDLTFASLDAVRGSQNSQFPADALNHLTVDVADGIFRVNGLLSLNSNGNAVISARDGGTLSAGTISANIRGNVLARAANVATGTFGTIFTNQDSSWLIGGDLTLASNLSAGGNVSLSARNITVGNILSQNNVFLGVNPTGLLSSSIVTGSISTPLGSISGSSSGTIATGPLFAGDYIDLYGSRGITINGAAIAGALANTTQGKLPGDGGIYLYTDSGPITTGDLTGQYVNVEAGDSDDDVDVAAFDAASIVRVGNVTAKQIDITSSGTVTTGALTVTNALYPRLALPADESPIVFVGALGNVVTGNVTGTGFGLIASRDGSVTTGNLTFTGSVAVLAGQNVTVGQVTTGRGANDLFYVANSSVLNDPLLADYFDSLVDQDIDDGDVPFSPALFLRVTPTAIGGALSIGGVNTGTLIAGAQSIRLGTTDASQRIQLIATGLIDVTGAVAAPQIDFRSTDLDIGAQGRLGNASTTALNLVSTSQAGMILGGDGSGNGYRLSAAEAARLSAQKIVINGGTGTVTIRELALTGSGATGDSKTLNGSAGVFEVRGAGVVRVEGAVTMTGAQSTDRLNLIAGTRIEVATDSGGSIALRGAQSNTLGGTLSFAAPVVAVGPNSTLTRLAENPRFVGRDAVLAAAASSARPEGYIQANTIAFAANNLIAVQNSGTTLTSAGFTVGTGGLIITNSGNGQTAANTTTATPLEVRIYGRQQRADGTFVTNAQALAAITRSSDPTALDSGSGANNCLFTAASCAGSAEEISVSPSIQALVEAASDGDPVEAAAVPAIRIVRLLDETAIDFDPVVTDPVTGGGNAGLWDNDDDEDDDKNADGTEPAAATPTPAAGDQ